MRLTVGPLPPTVYWRRRAVVLGAGLLFLIVLLYSCTGPGRDKGTSGSGAGPTSSATAAPGPTGSVLTPQSGDPSPTPGAAGGSSAGPDGGQGGPDGGQGGPSGGGTGSTGNNGAGAPAAPVADDGACADSEIKVTAEAVPSSVQQGAVVTLRLKIQNVSNRTCSRDVGADLQELYVKAGADKVWSSDTCGTQKGSDVQSFTPDFVRSYELGWNGRDTSRCNAGLAAGPYAPIGSYQVFARVGTRISEPVKLTVTG